MIICKKQCSHKVDYIVNQNIRKLKCSFIKIFGDEHNEQKL